MKRLTIISILALALFSCTKKEHTRINKCHQIKRSAVRLSEYVNSAYERNGDFPTNKEINEELKRSDLSWVSFSGEANDWEFSLISENQYSIHFKGKVDPKCDIIFTFKLTHVSP